MKFTDEIYIEYDPFSGSDRDTDIRQHKVKIVKTRKIHPCMLSNMIGEQHDIPIGSRARYDSAIVDGEWGGYHCCLSCMDKWLIEDWGLEPIMPPVEDKSALHNKSV